MSALAGACQSDGTCICGSGYVLNPKTGLCYHVDVAPDASVATDIGVGKDAGKVLADAPVGNDIGRDVADVPVTGDTSGACTPGMDQTCNDSPIASYVSGTCQSNGTCICKSGYVINPSTARCMVPAAGTCAGTYEACGCGCCGSGAPSPVCYYPSAGDSLSAIIAADQAAKSSPTCALAGCALGQWYLCCMEAAAEPASSAQYSATYTSGAYDRIGLTKTEGGGNCVRLNLVNPGSGGSGRRPLRVTTPDNWAIEGSIFAGACGSSSPAQAIGAQGTVSFSPSGTSACAISAHMTLFFAATADAPVTTMRIDADNVLISGGGPEGYCQ
jgi:hypothetical protein